MLNTCSGKKKQNITSTVILFYLFNKKLYKTTEEKIN